MNKSVVPVAANPVSQSALATAAWGTFDDAKRRIRTGELLLGYHGGYVISMDDDRHILLVGGTRGGKGVSIIVPNLLIYPGSVIVIDPKGENAIVSARRRGGGSAYCEGMGQRVVLLDPFHAVQTPEDNFDDLRGGFNPLDLVSAERPDTIDDAARIADALIVSESTQDPYWEEAARSLIKVVILHVVSSPDFPPDSRTLVTVRALLVGGDMERQKIAAMTGGKKSKASGLSLLFAAMKRNQAFGGVIARAGEMFGNLEANSPRTMASIAQIACTNTDFIDSPGMQRCLSVSSFKMSDLKTERAGFSLYVCLPQGYMETHYRWLRMLTTLQIVEMERYRARPANGHSVLMVLDEYPALKRMRVIENAAARIAGFGVRILFAVQNLPQLKDLYKDNWETLVANSGIKVFFANDDNFTREYVSKMVGECEIVRTTRTVSETSGTTRSEADGHTHGHTETHSRGLGAGLHAGISQGHSIAKAGSVTSTSTRGVSGSTTVAFAETLHKRPLITPDEVGRFFGNQESPKALLLVSGQQPFMIDRYPYYNLSMMTAKYDWHPHYQRPPTLLQRRQEAGHFYLRRAGRRCDERGAGFRPCARLVHSLTTGGAFFSGAAPFRRRRFAAGTTAF